MADSKRVFVGIDVGGTFTDLVLFDPANRLLKTVKVASTPPDFWPSVIEALEAAGLDKQRPADRARYDRPPERLSRTQGREDRAGHDCRFPRCLRDAPWQSDTAL